MTSENIEEMVQEERPTAQTAPPPEVEEASGGKEATLAAAALLNLTGLGLGYLYVRRWLRWMIHFLLTAGRSSRCL